MADPKKQKNQAQKQAQKNVMESLKDLGQGVAQDAVRQVLGTPEPYKKPANEITNSAELRYIAEQKLLQRRIMLERQQVEEERRVSQEKLGNLRLQLKALISETQKVMVASQEMAEKAEAAIYNIPQKAGSYYTNFLQNFINYMTNVAENIGEAATWLAGHGARREKKTFMNIFKNKKKGGAGYLLSGEHYVARSAG